MTQSANKKPLDSETSSEGQAETDVQPEVQPEQHVVPPIAQKVSRFGPQGGSQFGKGVKSFNPPNKQRPGRAAARGR